MGLGGWRQKTGQRYHTDGGVCGAGGGGGGFEAHKARNMQTLRKKRFHLASFLLEHFSIPMVSNTVQILAGFSGPIEEVPAHPSSLYTLHSAR